MFDCIIVGGGAAGLMAARILSAKGKNILLLEAKEKLGGRINEVSEGFSFNVEEGAEFIHGNLKTTLKLLKEAGLNYTKTEGEIINVRKGEWSLQDSFIEDWNLLEKRLKKLKEDITITDFLRQYFPEEKYSELRNSFIGYVEGYDAADINLTSSFAIREEMEEGENENFRIDKCYGSLITFLATECRKNSCIIKTSEPVLEINWNKNNVEVITTIGKYTSQKILLTVSVGILQSDETYDTHIKFSPSLTKQIQTAKQIGFSNVIKILMEFEDAFWFDKEVQPIKNPVNPFFFFAETFISTWWTQYPSRAPLLTGWFAGSKAMKYKGLSDEEIFKHSITSLALIFNMEENEIQKKLKHYKIINWINDPYCKGAYSYPTLTTKQARKILQTPVENTIYFAGEALAKKSNATVDAALVSGKSAAKQILRHI